MKIIITTILLTTGMSSYACDNPNYNTSPLNTEYVSTPKIPRTRTIKGPFEIKQVEKKHTYAPTGTDIAIPFGTNNNKWIKFKENYNTGDLIYFVKKEVKTTCCNNSLEKYIIVRNECVIAKYIVKSNGIVEGKI